MGGAPGGAALVFLVDVVLDEAADGLEGEGADYDDADYGVAVAGCELEDAWGGLLVLTTWLRFEGVEVGWLDDGWRGREETNLRIGVDCYVDT